MAPLLDSILLKIPDSLRNELVEAYRNIERNFRESRWEPSELNGGKLCEIVYSILRGYLDGAYPAKAYKPENMVAACAALEKYPGSFPRSVRIQIPRMLTALYEVRNNRGVGHVGGDVNPNHMDATCVLYMSKWILAEMIRVFHDDDGVTTEEASAMVDAISDREIMMIWKINGVSRVLNTSLKMLDKTLLLLYGAPTGIPENELVKSIEHSNAAVYRRDVLRKAHSKKLLEYDPVTLTVTISPLGSRYVEDNIPLNV